MSKRNKYTKEEYQQKVDFYSFLKDNVSINNGNEKTGKACLTLSMPAIISCAEGVPCAHLCYTQRGRMKFPKVCGAYYRNYRIWQESHEKFEKQLDAALTYNALPLLRIHDSGDFVDREYLEMLCRVMEKHPEIKAMAFTKKYELVNDFIREGGKIPDNLCIRFSAWDKSWEVPNPFDLPMSYVDFKDSSKNPDIPKNAFLCRGGKDGVTCSNCRACFNKNVKAVRLLEH